MKSDAFRKAAESKDFSAAESLFVENPVFRSPAVHRPYEGGDAMLAVLGSVVQIFEDFRYTGQFEDGNQAVLLFEARVGDKEINGVDVLTFADDGRIEELMVMIRPLRGLEAVVQGMAEKLAALGVPLPGSAATS